MESSLPVYFESFSNATNVSDSDHGGFQNESFAFYTLICSDTIGFFIVFLNSGVISITIYSKCILKDPRFLYHLCYSSADLLVGVSILLQCAIRLLNLHNMHVGGRAIVSAEYVFFASINISYFMLVLISFVQFHSVWFPVKHTKSITISFVVTTCMATWMLVIVLSFALTLPQKWSHIKDTFWIISWKVHFQYLFNNEKHIMAIAFWLQLVLLVTINTLSMVKAVERRERHAWGALARESSTKESRPSNSSTITTYWRRLKKISASVAPMFIGRISLTEENRLSIKNNNSNNNNSETETIQEHVRNIYVVESSPRPRAKSFVMARSSSLSSLSSATCRRDGDSRASKRYSTRNDWPPKSNNYLEELKTPGLNQNCITMSKISQTSTENNTITPLVASYQSQAQKCEILSSRFSWTRCERTNKELSTETSVSSASGGLMKREDSFSRRVRQSKIFCVTKNNSTSTKSSLNGAQNSDLQSTDRKRRLRKYRPMKGNLTLAVFVLVFVLLSGPFYVAMTLQILFPKTLQPDLFYEIVAILRLAMFSNFIANPIIAMIRLPVYKETIDKIKRKTLRLFRTAQ